MIRYNKRIVDETAGFDFELDTVNSETLMEFVGTVNDKSLIDIGCGGGKYARLFASRGASVLGIDREASQLTVAKNSEYSLSPTSFEQADFTSTERPKAKFDIALLCFVILDIRTETDFVRLIEYCGDVLAVGGRLIIFDNHPHNFNRENPFEHVRSNFRYFDNATECESNVLKKNGEQILFKPNFHFRLDFIVNEFSKRGFRLKRILEIDNAFNFPTHILFDFRKT